MVTLEVLVSKINSELKAEKANTDEEVLSFIILNAFDISTV